MNHNLEPTIDLFFRNPDIELAALYAPEHGIRGDEKIFIFTDSSNLPVYSLYGLIHAKINNRTKHMRKSFAQPV